MNKNLIKIALLVGALVQSWTSFAVAQNEDPNAKKPETLTREIFVPLEDLNVILNGNVEHIYLKREEYEALVKKAAEALPANIAAEAPTLLNADYEGTVEDQRARFLATFTIESTSDQPQTLRLPFANVSLLRASWGDRPVGLLPRNDGVDVVVDRKGRAVLSIEFLTPLTTIAASQKLTMQVAMPPASKMRLRLAGDSSIKSGAEIISETKDAAQNLQIIEMLPKGELIDLELSLGSSLKQANSAVISRSVIVSEVTSTYEKLHVTTFMDMLHGAADNFTFSLPNDYEVTEVNSPSVSRFEVTTGESSKILKVYLREATTDDVSLEIAAVRTKASIENWTFPKFVPLNTQGQVAIVGLLLEESLNLYEIASAKLIRLDNSLVAESLPPSVSDVEPGAPKIRIVGSFYAPNSAYDLSAKFLAPKKKIETTASLLYEVREVEQSLKGSVVLLPKNDRLFQFELSLPPAWTFKSFSPEISNYELISTAEGVRAIIRLNSAVPAEKPFPFTFEAKAIPDGWLGEWGSQKVTFPELKMNGNRIENLTMAIDGQDDFRVEVVKADNLIPISESEKWAYGISQWSTDLAFRSTSESTMPELQVFRTQPLITARSYSFLKVEKTAISGHYEIVFEVSRARTRQLQFSLPESTPSTISIAGLENLAIKESNHKESEGRRIWTTTLANPTSGTLKLSIDLSDSAPTNDVSDLSLPVVKAEQVDFETAMVAVEGDSELDVSVATDGRKVDVGELAEASYLVGQRLLGAYGYLGPASPIKVSVFRRPAFNLPDAIVERAELVSLVSDSGIVQTAGRYLLRTKSPFLEVELPEDAELWAIQVDNLPAKPQRDKGKVLVSLRGTGQGNLRDIQVVYQSPISTFSLSSTISTRAPQLYLRTETEDERRLVPVGSMTWNVDLPESYAIVSQSGGFKTSQLRTFENPVVPAFGIFAVPFFLLGEISISTYKTEGAAYDRYAMKSVAPASPLVTSAPYPQATTPDFDRFNEARESRDYSTFLAKGDSAAPAGAKMPESELPKAEEPAFAAGETALPQFTQPPLEELKKDNRNKINDTWEHKSEITTWDEADKDGLQNGPAKRYWAMQGINSLKFSLDDQTRNSLKFSSLGADPNLKIGVVRTNSISLFLYAIFGVTSIVAFLYLWKSGWNRLKLVCIILLLASISYALGAFSIVFEAIAGTLALSAVFYTCCYFTVAAFRLAASMAKWTWNKVLARQIATVRVASLLVVIASATANGQEVVTLPGGEGPPVKIPDDAILIPYDAELGIEGVKKADKVMVPYKKYVELFNLANPEKKLGEVAGSIKFGMLQSEYQVTLGEGDDLIFKGTIDIESFVDGEQEIPLRLARGVLTEAKLDGAKASVRMVAPTADPQQQAQPSGPGIDSIPDSMLLVVVSGKGMKKLEFTVRLRVEKQGGWRSVQASIPVAPLGRMILNIPLKETELQFENVIDRSNYSSKQDSDKLEIGLPSNGSFRFAWRAKVAEAVVDQSLTVQSVSLVDIQEDGVHVKIQSIFDFRRSRRKSLTVEIPAGFLVEQVSAPNLRDWRVQTQDTKQTLDVEFLNEVADTATLEIALSKRPDAGMADVSQEVLPVLTAPGARLQRGIIQVRRSPLVELRSIETTGARRDEPTPQEQDQLNQLAQRFESTVGTRPFQTFRFDVVPYRVVIESREQKSRIAADQQLIVRLTERETVIESSFIIRTSQRSIQDFSLTVPKGLEITSVECPREFEWGVRALENAQKLDIRLAAGLEGEMVMIIRGKTKVADVKSHEIPHIVVDAADNHAGTIAIQADPAFEVTTHSLTSLETVLPNRVSSWLNESQRGLLRWAFSYEGKDYSGKLELVARKPVITAKTISNVRTTDRLIEETLLIEFSVSNAGVREVVFRLPSWLENAEIRAPLLKHKRIDKIADSDEVRVTLSLQDSIMNKFQVLVRNDRLLKGGEQKAPIPAVETGETTSRYIVVENSGRDEIVIADSDKAGVEELARNQDEWNDLKAYLGNNITQAFFVKSGVEKASLRYQVNQRQFVETAGAKIGKAETRIAVDRGGGYRAQIEYFVTNDTEQYLEISLPNGAELWSTYVAGYAVKPTIVPDSKEASAVRIPLIKTALGDTSFPVVLKYGGKLELPNGVGKTSFPLVKTLNINVELSQVRLRLPDDFRWFNFGGTMRRIENEGDYRKSDVVHLTEEIKRLQLGLVSANPYAQLRAKSNLRTLGNFNNAVNKEALQSWGDQVSKEVQANGQAWQVANDLANRVNEESIERQLGLFDNNRDILCKSFDEQKLSRATNTIERFGNNFSVQEAAPNAAPNDAGQMQVENRSRVAQNFKSRGTVSAEQSAGQQGQAGGFGANTIDSKSGGRFSKSKAGDLQLQQDVEKSLKELNDTVQTVQQEDQTQQLSKPSDDAKGNISKYQRQLENNELAAQTLSNSLPASNDDNLNGLPRENSGTPYASNGPPSNGYLTPPSFPSGVTGGGSGFGGGAPRGMGSGGNELFGSVPPPVVVDNYSTMIPTQQAATSPPVYSSLDVALNFDVPGEDYFFTVPSGNNIEITANIAKTDWTSFGLRIGLVILAVALTFAVTRVSKKYARAAA